ncbi:MAG: hypothetical protein ACLUD2_04110 [Clostridium sp.]
MKACWTRTFLTDRVSRNCRKDPGAGCPHRRCVAQGWRRLSRMGKVELTILRQVVYEMAVRQRGAAQGGHQ